MTGSPSSAGLRFGFYVHVDYLWPEQQVASWPQNNQDAVRQMITTHGTVVDTYLDNTTTEVPSDTTPWGRRAQAHRLLRDLAANKLDAIAVGTVRNRTFAATPVWDVAMLLGCHGKQLWTADVGGPLDPTNSEHILHLKVTYGIPAPHRPSHRHRTRPKGTKA
ncbi:hypothetical protein [Actinomadura harenae]|uniref:Resolvase/invertase-type recombinase catalytic domain-containing protein n=1 Tax=Actinomadura harenae TaxID=2483351 RepID=A0A3M2LHP5_9ACTN|nr:hypothetical protein [Actinomadura harenae]RMI36999.1 hypothetical protein EBO15_37095 [Actinomadura harenae]